MTAYYSSKINAAGGLTLDHVPTKSGIGLVNVTVAHPITVALVNSDTIELFKLPAGATIVDFKAATNADIGTTSSSLNFGDAGNASRYCTGQFTTAGGDIRTIASTGLGYVTTAETTVIATAATMTAGTTDATLYVSCTYTMNP